MDEDVVHAGGTAVPTALLGVDLMAMRFGAMEYGLGRDAVTSTLPLPLGEVIDVIVPDPPSSSALRLVATLAGAWLDLDYCPRANHKTDCKHRRGRLYPDLKPLARTTFGADRQSQRRQTVAALDELATAVTYYAWNPTTGVYVRETSPIVTIRELGKLPAHARPGDAPKSATFEIAWAPFLLDSLLAGNYRRIPMGLVRGLRGRSAFRIWLQFFMHPAVAQLRKVGEYREFTVTGSRATIPAARLGLRGLRPVRMAEAIRQAAEVGVGLSEYGLEVMPTADGSALKVRVTLVCEVDTLPTPGGAFRSPQGGIWVTLAARVVLFQCFLQSYLRGMLGRASPGRNGIRSRMPGRDTAFAYHQPRPSG